MATLVFDIETIPAPVSDEHRATIERMAAKREQDAGMFMSLCPPLARVVACAMMNVDTENVRVLYDGSLLPEVPSPDGMEIVARDGEADLLVGLLEILGCFSRLITFGGRNFDLPVLIHRSRVHRVDVPKILTRAVWQKPWEDNPHLDLAHQFSFGGAGGRFPLAAYAIGYGELNPKQVGDGAQVVELVAAGRTHDLARYAAGDVLATAGLWKRWSG